MYDRSQVPEHVQGHAYTSIVCAMHVMRNVLLQNMGLTAKLNPDADSWCCPLRMPYVNCYIFCGGTHCCAVMNRVYGKCYKMTAKVC